MVAQIAMSVTTNIAKIAIVPVGRKSSSSLSFFAMVHSPCFEILNWFYRFMWSGPVFYTA